MTTILFWNRRTKPINFLVCNRISNFLSIQNHAYKELQKIAAIWYKDAVRGKYAFTFSVFFLCSACYCNSVHVILLSAFYLLMIKFEKKRNIVSVLVLLHIAMRENTLFKNEADILIPAMDLRSLKKEIAAHKTVWVECEAESDTFKPLLQFTLSNQTAPAWMHVSVYVCV